MKHWIVPSFFIMDDNFVNEEDEQLIKALLQNKPTFSEELIDFYLSQNGCKVTEKSCLRLISLILHKSIDSLVNNSLSSEAGETRNDTDKENKNTVKRELNYKKMIKALKEFNQNCENDETVQNLNLFFD
ncbi:transcription initiation factor TFIID subunit 10, putative (TAF10) [Plasmodium ovale wallikeri]|nr:transcription initiation factor TFIID subunit 10, putative (TAF10) [Plasmodium ovale wallikeri]SBT36514.1 transcription initiation factor TFIID subunit 10, putative (TAF10) [Plasmodium ovale wallikeri]